MNAQDGRHEPADVERLAAEPLDGVDDRILATLRSVHEASDPTPAGLADRARFAVSLAALEAELVELTTLTREDAGVRGGYELATSMTFSGEHLSAMVRIETQSNGTRGVHGWVSTPLVRVELRSPSGTQTRTVDAEGRFEFAHVRPGLSHLVFWRTDLPDARPLITPAMEI